MLYSPKLPGSGNKLTAGYTLFVRVRKGVQQSNIGLSESPGCRNGANIEKILVLVHCQVDTFSPAQLSRGLQHTQLNTYTSYTVCALPPTVSSAVRSPFLTLGHLQHKQLNRTISGIVGLPHQKLKSAAPGAMIVSTIMQPEHAAAVMAAEIALCSYYS